jgi:hypothetical protein
MDAFVRESIKMACDCSSDGRLGEAQRELTVDGTKMTGSTGHALGVCLGGRKEDYHRKNHQ